MIVLAGCGGSKKSADSTVAATETTAEAAAPDTTEAADTTVATETTVASETTEAADTTVAGDATDATVVSDIIGSTDAPGIAKLVAAGIKEGSNGEITDAQADCIGKAVLDKIGAAKLIEIGNDKGSDFTNYPADVQEKVFDAMGGCVTNDEFAQVIGAQIAADASKDLPLTADQGTCFAKGLLDRFGLKKLAAFGSAGFEFNNLPASEQGALFSVMGNCLSTDELAALFASGMTEDGSLTTEEATCMAKKMIEQFGIEKLPTLADPDKLSAKDQAALVEAATGCISIEKLAAVGSKGTSPR